MSRFQKFEYLPVIPDPEQFGFERAGGHYTPSPQEIRQQCALIRATWSPGVAAQRSAWAAEAEQVRPLEEVTPGSKC